tara:strand:+ start:397 stop:630 length:234 start_codon:yes stop_codon:yes gene_type:complete
VSETAEIIGIDLAEGKDVSVVLVKSDRGLPLEELQQIAASLPKGTLVIAQRPGESLELLSEEDMNRCGWFKKEVGNE